jgi:hypothetical protein
VLDGQAGLEDAEGAGRHDTRVPITIERLRIEKELKDQESVEAHSATWSRRGARSIHQDTGFQRGQRVQGCVNFFSPIEWAFSLFEPEHFSKTALPRFEWHSTVVKFLAQMIIYTVAENRVQLLHDLFRRAIVPAEDVGRDLRAQHVDMGGQLTQPSQSLTLVALHV